MDGALRNGTTAGKLSAESTQASGDLWAVPQRLMTLAEIQVARGRYREADREYDRAEAFIDSMLGNLSTSLEFVPEILCDCFMKRFTQSRSGCHRLRKVEKVSEIPFRRTVQELGHLRWRQDFCCCD
jgi:hypothetical protein